MSEPTVAVYDPITTIRWNYDVERDILAAHGVALLLPPTLEEARAVLPRADVVVASGRLPSEELDLMTRCTTVLCYSVGMDGVDAARAAQLGIEVTNVPDYCTEEVSDQAIALFMALQRALVPTAAAATQGDWQVRHWDEFYRMRRVRGQTMGVVGLGRIGGRVAEKAQGLGMTAIAHDPYRADAPVPLLPLPELLERSDAVVLCAALTAESRHLIDAAAIARMRDDAVLVNVARGGLVDEAALAAALRAGRLRGAALDVREAEPPPPETDPLLGLRNVVLTQHVGATSVEAFADMHTFAAARILDALRRHGRLPA
ncbi:NAD(P)-dependent oxidoreductase [Dactylosporangium fulvum]|uniref:Hydroxyacid dehydrogenase n=1 Tax=Dactylosporangium fulvum TaxID=53359 RepID=A0ABY5VT43_9ACTN|nr:NAD(P)-dependent oxidoreductase [Dactylosporangium fulvum]UWP79996.1 hydroxyacid dehydrogenase [Dactylosporangium fulvum]